MGNKSQAQTSDIRKVAAASLIGTAIEWYDFFIFGTAAALLFNELFFPSYGAMVGTLASLGTFGAGFFARPLGGLVFGHFGDRIGRKRTLVITLTLMGTATLLVGMLPTYGQIGVLAPILLVFLRLVQGFAVGGEWGGAVLMAVEHSPEERRGFYGSWPQMGVPIGLVASSGIIFLLSSGMSDEAFRTWGWRVPFLASALLIVVGLVMRLKVAESPEFKRLVEDGERVATPIADVLRHSWRETILVIGSQAAVNVGFYVITVYALSYAEDVGISKELTLIALCIGAVFDLAGIIFFAGLSDRIGRKPLLMAGSVFMALFAYPFFVMVDSGEPVLLFIAVSAGLALGHAPTWATMSSFLAETFDARSRYSGVSTGYQLAGVVFSGPTPIVAGALVAAYGGIVPVVVMIVGSCLIALASVALMSETRIRSGKPGAATSVATSVVDG